MLEEPFGVLVMFKEGVNKEQVDEFIKSYDLTGHILNPHGSWPGKKLMFFVKIPKGEEVRWVIEFKNRKDMVEDSTQNQLL